MQQPLVDFQVIKIQPNSGNQLITFNNVQITFNLGGGYYDVDKTIIQFKINGVEGKTNNDLIFVRQDFFPVSNCIVTLDSKTIGQYSQLWASQLIEYQQQNYKTENYNNFNQEDWICIGNSTNTSCKNGFVNYKLRHFLGGLFDSEQQYLQVINKCQIQFQTQLVDQIDWCAYRNLTLQSQFNVIQNNTLDGNQQIVNSPLQSDIVNFQCYFIAKFQQAIPDNYRVNQKNYLQYIFNGNTTYSQPLVDNHKIYLQDVFFFIQNKYDEVDLTEDNFTSFNVQRNNKNIISTHSKQMTEIAKLFDMFKDRNFNNCSMRIKEVLEKQNFSFTIQYDSNLTCQWVLGMQYTV